MWLLAFESLASLLWIVALAGSLDHRRARQRARRETCSDSHSHGGSRSPRSATLQLIVALTLERAYDPTSLRAFVLAAPYPLAYWILAAAAALRAQAIALIRGPRGQRVAWDIPRERLETAPEAAKGPPSQNR